MLRKSPINQLNANGSGWLRPYKNLRGWIAAAISRTFHFCYNEPIIKFSQHSRQTHRIRTGQATKRKESIPSSAAAAAVVAIGLWKFFCGRSLIWGWWKFLAIDEFYSRGRSDWQNQFLRRANRFVITSPCRLSFDLNIVLRPTGAL